MATAEELAELDAQALIAATEPVSASVDGQSVTSRSLKDLADYRDRLAAQTALAGPRGGWGRVVRNRAVPPGGGPT
jgi:hypothetical protein